MPELPEVETFANELRPHLVGQQFVAAHILWPRTLAEPDAVALDQRIRGRVVVDVGRRAKYLIIGLDSSEALIVHLRMTGRLEVVRSDDPILTGPHLRAWFDLAGGERLTFTDTRKFGRIWLVSDLVSVTGKLGPEPLDWRFTSEVLGARLQSRRLTIKSLLLDQTVVAGVGNIYADESLFLAGIHPLRPADSLTDGETSRLHSAIRQVLSEAIGNRGTMLRDYRPPYGAEGGHQEHLRVYQQTGKPCPRCGAPIERIRVTQRSTHFCPSCQPEVKP
jgi:formamidopyrimidine-DNA glycosylase